MVCLHPGRAGLLSCAVALRVFQAEKNAFFVADLGVLMRQHVLWQTHMPRVRPFYTLKCNSSPAVIQVLAALGTGFVCANKVKLHTHTRKHTLHSALASLSSALTLSGWDALGVTPQLCNLLNCCILSMRIILKCIYF